MKSESKLIKMLEFCFEAIKSSPQTFIHLVNSELRLAKSEKKKEKDSTRINEKIIIRIWISTAKSPHLFNDYNRVFVSGVMYNN